MTRSFSVRNRRLFATLFVLVFLLWVSRLGLTQTANAAGNEAVEASGVVGSSKPILASRQSDSSDPYNTAYNYVVTFYPRWFTWIQPAGGFNGLIGPVRISPIYQAVVAINDDTFYASAFFSLTNEPVVVTVPSTTDVYSVLVLDQYGNVLPGITAAQPGQPGAVYWLTGPGWSGTIPPGVIQVQPGVNNGEILFRADKYVKNGNVYQDMRQEAQNFRRNICLIPLSKYQPCPKAGQAQIVPEAVFGVSYKNLAVSLIANQPIWFLDLLQKAVLSPTTQPLTPDEQTLSDSFNALFSDRSNWPQMAAGTKAAHVDIDYNYVTHTLTGTSWVNFTNIGTWDQTFQGYLDRSGITDYLQFGNNASAAAYFHAFADGNGIPLDGSAHDYILTFQQGEQPNVSRFWSVTAYLPRTIELVPNSVNKYVLAGYTPGLVTAPDGSVSIVMAVNKPAGVPQANWLPIPKGPFNIMLRAYGPQWNQDEDPYVPPLIQVLH
jgi:hypothetical protein